MSQKIKIPLCVFAFLYLTYHLFTLSSNPFPWEDEVFFASIAKNFEESRSLVAEVSKETFQGKQVFIYGPVHFFLESLSFRTFGFGIFQYRWIIFSFGIVTIIATVLILRLCHNSFKNSWLLIIIFALDPFLNLSMHEGRMDLEAIAMMLIAIYFLIKGLREQNNKFFFLSGFFTVIAILTTPRIGIVVLPVTLFFLFEMEGKSRKNSLQKILLWSAPIAILYGSWMFYSYGGIIELFNYYKNIQDTNGDYLGGKFYVPKHEYLLIFLTIISIIYGVLKRGKNYFNMLVAISLASIALFYVAIVDWGPYSALILPFYYFLLFYSLGEVEFNFKKFSFYPVILLLIFNLSYFSLKAVQVIADKDTHHHSIADEFVKKNIPEGSKVIGDGQYYYSVIKAKSEYRIYDQHLSAEAREKVLREIFDYDYIIITERYKENETNLVKLFLNNAEFKKVAELKINQSDLSKKIGSLGIVSNMEKNGYNAEIYMRIKDQKSQMAVR